MTIAAAESDEPERAVSRAVTSVVLRVLTLYVASSLLIVLIVPWNDTKLGDSPFIAALDRIGIPGAADVKVFLLLVNSSGAIALFVYICSSRSRSC